MDLRVFKFGGASVKNGESIRNVSNILQSHANEKLLTVVSAAGKTTNALEAVTNSYFHQDGNVLNLFEKIKQDHLMMLKDLELTNEEVLADISDTFIEIEWMIEDEVQDGYDYVYDQIVSVGELISSKILYQQCKKLNLNAKWLDVRDVIITDNTYREAKVLWEETVDRMNSLVKTAFEDYDLVITQGFIGSSTENFNTTLGREGSDYSAGIFAYGLDAKDMTIWKDVPGILTADPKLFKNVTKIDRLDYREAIEMTYFGAKVIHPKTIKPLQNKAIPLYVKPFNDPQSKGTLIGDNADVVYPPVIVIEDNQTLIHVSTKDFSFVVEKHLSEIFAALNDCRLKVNMMRNTAISFSVSVSHSDHKIKNLEDRLSDRFSIVKDENLELITVRHFDEMTVNKMKEGKVILFEEIIRNTVRMAVRDIPAVERV